MVSTFLSHVRKALGRRYRHYRIEARKHFTPRAYVADHVRFTAKTEPELKLLPALCRPDLASVDIGVLFGAYSSELLRVSRQCYAFEPNPHQVAFLRRAFHTPRYILEECAVSDVDGKAEMRVPKLSPGIASIHALNTLASWDVFRFQVQTRRLDSFELSPVGFIKIDVEGHESAVVRGMENTLRAQLPVLLIEASDRMSGGDTAALFAFLGSLDYRAFVCDAGQLSAVEVYSQAAADEFFKTGLPDYRAHNFVFVPTPSLNRFSSMMAPASPLFARPPATGCTDRSHAKNAK